MEKGCLITLVTLNILPIDDNLSLDADALRKAIAKDKKKRINSILCQYFLIVNNTYVQMEKNKCGFLLMLLMLVVHLFVLNFDIL